MYRNLIPVFLSIIISIVFISCERDVSIELPDAESRLVVEGYIFEGDYAEVILTKSSGYFSAVNETSIADLLVTDAQVIVTSNGVQDTLTLTFDNNRFPPIFFRGNSLIGTQNTAYELQIVHEGETYNANTYIPTTVPLDSAWFKRDNPNNDLGFIWVRLSEPAGLGNCYRWYAKRIGKDARFYTPLRSAIEDKFIDGRTFDFPNARGSKPNSEEPDDQFPEAGFFKLGDTVAFMFCSLTFETFDFIRGVEYESANNGNPFASPTFINSKIDNGALGYFGGYAVYRDTLVLVD
jgi:hypothetical protein